MKSMMNLKVIQCFRVVTKISSCRVNTTSRRGNQTARNVVWFYFLLFSNKSRPGATLIVAGENPRPATLNDNPGVWRKKFRVPFSNKYFLNSLASSLNQS